MPKMTVEEMKAHMPQRPAELDLLDMFVGNWDFTGEAKMDMLADRDSLTMTGHSEYKWEGDRWYLVGNGTFTMEPFGESKGMEMWTYDLQAKKFRSTWVDTMGSFGVGEARYDEETSTWHMKGTSFGAWGKSTSKGSMHFPDANHMEWEFAEYQGLMKTIEMTGKGERVR
jgi:hypothetical protein